MLLDPNELFGDCNRTEAGVCTDGVGPGGRWDSPGCQMGEGAICGGGCAIWDPTPVFDVDSGTVHVLFGRSTSSCRGGPAAGLREDLWVMTSEVRGRQPPSSFLPQPPQHNCSSLLPPPFSYSSPHPLDTVN